MTHNDSKMKVIAADNFSTETKYRMTLEYGGESFYWIGYIGEFGGVEEWFDLAERKIQEPDWADSIDFFDLCDDNSKQNLPSDLNLIEAIEKIIATDGEKMTDGECLDEISQLINKYKTLNLEKAEELQPRDLVADHEQTRSADAEMGDL